MEREKLINEACEWLRNNVTDYIIEYDYGNIFFDEMTAGLRKHLENLQ